MGPGIHMRVFVTGASGFIGSPSFRSSSPQATRSSAWPVPIRRLRLSRRREHRSTGVIAENLASLRAGAETAQGMIHLAFNHGFTDYAGAADTERRAVAHLARCSRIRPAVRRHLRAGRVRTRRTSQRTAPPIPTLRTPRSSGASVRLARSAGRGSSAAARRCAAKVSLIRSPPDRSRAADRRGVSQRRLRSLRRRYRLRCRPPVSVGTRVGTHRRTAARRRRQERPSPRNRQHHRSSSHVARARHRAGRGRRPLGWLGVFFSLDVPASSALTRELLGHSRPRPGLLDDLE